MVYLFPGPGVGELVLKLTPQSQYGIKFLTWKKWANLF